MNHALAREVIGCLRVSGSTRAHAERLSGYGLRDWTRTLRWLDEAGLTLLLWQRLKQLGAASVLPAPLSAAFERNLGDHRRRIAEMAAEFDDINRAFENAGVEYVALKGFALIPEYCSLASLRTTYDYDYLVRPNELERACRTIEAAHYLVQPGSADQPLVYFHDARPPCSPRSREDLYSGSFPRTVELHPVLWNPEELKIWLDLRGDFFAHKRLRHLTGKQLDVGCQQPSSELTFWALGGEDELLFQLLHAFRHILQDWCRLASLLDIASFVQRRASDARFWENFLARIRSCPLLREIAGLVLSLSTRLFRASLPEAVSVEAVRPLRSAVALWVDRYGLESALDNFSGNKFSLLLYRKFVADVATWRAIERGRLFPIHRPNRAAEASTRGLTARLAAAWKQSVYVSQRLHHHVLGAARYRIERPRWERMFVGDRQAAAPPSV
jgi:hypothetical protein